MVCAYCNREYTGVSKTSRRDNKTEICAICAEFEAVSEFFVHSFQKPTEPVLKTIFWLFALRFTVVS
jgi:hypothetical protein